MSFALWRPGELRCPRARSSASDASGSAERSSQRARLCGLAAAAAQLLELLETKFANGWLKDSPFLAGDAPTIADFRFGPVMLFARVAVRLPERVEAYLARLERDVPGYTEATEPARAFVADKIKK